MTQSEQRAVAMLLTAAFPDDGHALHFLDNVVPALENRARLYAVGSSGRRAVRDAVQIARQARLDIDEMNLPTNTPKALRQAVGTARPLRGTT